ncbi:outer membrane protein assembly factor BamD [Pelomicrobium methylotrophicum]|uniref:Outer membrane protein assembly factor BamD n=1 Tax=Pelomicrobium methylotrophicum TaxID=2602750 RepID=A0A5C7EJU9_9PROT|nr:outer membrane protein assembly factor BamD [Pelomicrobium methylotrophicum]TXF11717.1 outer membrane protein assembly factor BamD [Pelomicrobium methylotrophicum]
MTNSVLSTDAKCLGWRFAHLAAIAALSLSLFGCGLLPTDEDPTRDWSASRLYSEAKAELNDGNYQNAIKLYEKLEARYPYGRYALQAQLEIAYAYYKDGETASAISAADRFIKLHPNHPNVDYAYYLKGLANFQSDLGIFSTLGGDDFSDRDPKAAREAFEAFKELVTRFPQSRYTPDAQARMSYLVNALASHEVHVARYYMRRGAFVAAVNRAKYVLENYPQAPALEEALAIMVRAYDAMGMPKLRDDARRVLEKNFPNSVHLAGGPPRRPWWKLW